MKRFFLLTLASAALLGASAAPVKTYEVKSPDGRLALVLTAGERLSFTVARDGETLVAPSEMALTLSTGEVLGESPRVRSARRRAVTETIDAPLYRQSRFDAAYNELDLRLRGDYGILARAYDDGVCYRFYTERDGELTIVDETAQLNFEGDPSAYIPYSKTEIPMRTSFENTYEYAPLSLDGAKIVIANTNKRRGLTDSKYNERRGECEAALERLMSVVNISHLCELDEEQFEKYKDVIKDPVLIRRARHAVSENQRTLRAVTALKEGRLDDFGKLMNESSCIASG